MGKSLAMNNDVVELNNERPIFPTLFLTNNHMDLKGKEAGETMEIKIKAQFSRISETMEGHEAVLELMEFI